MSDSAEIHRSPGDALSHIYETLLAHRPSDPPGFALVAGATHAKQHGAFYTRPVLARAVVEAALRPIRDRLVAPPSSFRILDPAMGTGVFLLAAVRALVASGVGDAAYLAESCLFGYDVDPLAVELAILSLCIETGADRRVLARHLRVHDPLTAEAETHQTRFDLVVGNPPWGAAFSADQRLTLRQRWVHPDSGSLDSFKLFLELAVGCSDGAIGMIVPRAFLNGSTHAHTRGLLLRHFAPYEVRTLAAGEFPRAVAPACSLIFGPRPGPELIVHHTPDHAAPVPPRHPGIPARFWTRDRFPLHGGELLDLLTRLCDRHPRLEQLAQLYRVRDAGINYNRASIARRILYTGDEAEHPADLPRYRGRDFTRFGAVRQGGWLRHDAQLTLQSGDRLYLSRETYDLPEKIVLRQTADRIIATLDRTRMVMGRSVLAVVAVGAASLLPLLACLNSRLMTRLYRALAGEEGRVLAQVKVKTVMLLPLPQACLAGNEDPRWVELGEMAQQRLAGPDDAAARLDGEIDRAVHALFGLSAAEIALFETPEPQSNRVY